MKIERSPQNVVEGYSLVKKVGSKDKECFMTCVSDHAYPQAELQSYLVMCIGFNFFDSSIGCIYISM